MSKYYYDLAGIILELDLPFPLDIRQESVPFIVNQCSPDVHVQCSCVECLPSVPADAIWVEDVCSIHLDSCVHTFFRNQSEILAVRTDFENSISLQYLPQFQKLFTSSHDLLNYLGIETVLLRYSGFLLHASFISWNGDGILFSAPCGTGKSTQAALWNEHRGAEIINGDRAAVRLIGDKWYAFGIPFAGTSEVYKNVYAPVKGAVLLSQGPQNVISKVPSMHALRRILPEVSASRTDRVSVNSVIDLILNFLDRVPVFALDCLPDEGAVDLLWNTIYKGNEL